MSVFVISNPTSNIEIKIKATKSRTSVYNHDQHHIIVNIHNTTTTVRTIPITK
eukprot:m.288183 g.288183  ORF g.288183 m.288183 type:complete len:53 (-) comp199777_c0_seq1:35-193(-)